MASSGSFFKTDIARDSVQVFIKSCYNVYRFRCIINIVFECSSCELTLDDCQKMTNCVINSFGSTYFEIVHICFKSA